MLIISVLFEHYFIFSRPCNTSATGSFFWVGELMPCYQHFSKQKYTEISHVLGDIYTQSQEVFGGLYKVSDGLMLSHDHRTMVAAYRTISRGRSQIVVDYHTMVVRWSCNNRRLTYDLDSKMLRSMNCGKNHCDCQRSLPVVGSPRS